MNERVETGTSITVTIPPGLRPAFAELVADYAKQHRETPEECVRGVEIAVLLRGIRSIRDELAANEALGERMGWMKNEGNGT